MQQIYPVDILKGPQQPFMANRVGSLGSEDGELISPQVLLAQLQALRLQNQATANAIDLQQALLTNSATANIPGGGLDPLLQAQLGLTGLQQKRGAPRQRRNEEQIRRTVYINDVDHAVSEHDLAVFFQHCGPIVDCRICGDANSAMRFAFIEFRSESGARAALGRTGATLGTSVIRVSPSKTAIVPVNNQYLPRSREERDAVARTVYVANIHRAVERDALHAFFLNLCGTVSKIRLLGDAQHDTKIAFVEFATAEGAAAALRCTGALLGPLPIRVSASKTPVRTEGRRIREANAAAAAAAAAQYGQPGVPTVFNGAVAPGMRMVHSQSMPSLYSDSPPSISVDVPSIPALETSMSGPLLLPPGFNFNGLN